MADNSIASFYKRCVIILDFQLDVCMCSIHRALFVVLIVLMCVIVRLVISVPRKFVVTSRFSSRFLSSPSSAIDT